ncbi:hypothetical protein [Spirosoma montaniterrae]|uniref:Uncharacterized protein n=1 Tax=Spirosoma montaniterrae TaxID=1178516 RepID=A0A1P9WZ54_9BACT|nr:hypothetical protein [Spirosoma montaniterrae]AQG80661.1 hypothetical protein AWR27_15805 [Spirosoma montaniterrae]
MKTHKLLDPDVEVFVNDDLDAYNEDGAFDDNWIVSARDLFRIVDMTDSPFESAFTSRAAA